MVVIEVVELTVVELEEVALKEVVVVPVKEVVVCVVSVAVVEDTVRVCVVTVTVAVVKVEVVMETVAVVVEEVRLEEVAVKEVVVVGIKSQLHDETRLTLHAVDACAAAGICTIARFQLKAILLLAASSCVGRGHQVQARVLDDGQTIRGVGAAAINHAILQRGIRINLRLRQLLQPPSAVVTAREQGLVQEWLQTQLAHSFSLLHRQAICRIGAGRAHVVTWLVVVWNFANANASVHPVGSTRLLL